MTRSLVFSMALATAAAFPLHSQQLEAPFRLEANGRLITVDNGHAQPFFGDIDHDGIPDLLVGQYGLGRLRIYRNLGTARDPKFGDFSWLMAGDDTATVDYG